MTATATLLYVREFMAFRNKTLEQKIQEIIDREEIRELMSRYAHRVAHGVPIADLFSDDGAFILRLPGRPVQETCTRQSISELFAHWRPGRPDAPKPMIHNQLLDISGDEATGTCSIEVRATENGEDIIGSGYYVDQYRREGGYWRFVLRDLTFFHWTPIEKGL